MINYSVFLMKNIQKPDEPKRAFAKNQVNEVWSFDKFVKHISDHNGVYTCGTVKGVIADMCDCLVEQLLNGNKIQMGELDDFSLSLKSEGADSMTNFTVRNIKEVKIIFSPGKDFENLVNRTEFNMVASRVAQSATLKAEKTGLKTVDLESVKKSPTPKPSTEGSDSGESTGGGTATGSNTGGGSDDGEEMEHN